MVDVESTLRHICKKVLTDTSVSKAELNRRAEAMLRAGTVFLRTESPDSLKDDGQRKTLRESLEAFVGPLTRTRTLTRTLTLTRAPTLTLARAPTLTLTLPRPSSVR